MCEKYYYDDLPTRNGNYVYIFIDESNCKYYDDAHGYYNVVKIGRTNNLRKRFNAFRESTCNGFFWGWRDCDMKASKVESIVHKFLKGEKCKANVECSANDKDKREYFKYPSVRTLYNLIEYVDDKGYPYSKGCMLPKHWNKDDDDDCYSELESDDECECEDGTGCYKCCLSCDKDENCQTHCKLCDDEYTCQSHQCPCTEDGEDVCVGTCYFTSRYSKIVSNNRVSQYVRNDELYNPKYN